MVINGCLSDAAVVSSRVPQGSILGPLLFVMFINDMFDCISSGTEMALYADDTKICRRIDEWGDHLALQRDIDALHLWSVTNKMKFLDYPRATLRSRRLGLSNFVRDRRRPRDPRTRGPWIRVVLPIRTRACLRLSFYQELARARAFTQRDV